MSQSNELLLCIENLFAGKQTHEANAFIQQHSETKDAWAASAQLLSATGAHIRYFCANILYNKVRKNWSQLDESERHQFFSLIMERVRNGVRINGGHDEKVCMSRLVLTLCSAAMRIPNGLNTYFTTALHMIQAAQSEEMALIGLDMITVVPEEVEAADLSRPVKVELTDQLHNSAPQFAQLVDGYSGQAATSRALLLALLRLVRAWLSCGMTLSKLFLDHRPTFDLVCASVQASDAEVVAQGCSVVREIAVLREYPRPAARTEALKVLVGCLDCATQALLAAHQPGYVHTAEHRIATLLTAEAPAIDCDAPFGAMCSEYCNTFAALAANDAEGELLCTGYSDPTDTHRVTEFIATFHSALMGIIRLRPRKMAFSTFDFWAEFADVSVGEWHPHVRENVIYELCCVVVAHCTYPAAAIIAGWGSCGGGGVGGEGGERDLDEEQEDFVAFRDARLGISEALVMCLTCLQGRFFGILQAKFDHFGMQLTRWSQLEVVLYVLQICMDTVKETVMKANYRDKAYQQSIVQFLYNVACCVLSISADAYRSHKAQALQQAVCRYLGALTFLLVGTADDRAVMQVQSNSGNPSAGVGGTTYVSSLYFTSLRTVLAAVGNGHAATATDAARALHKLCVHGSRLITDSAGNPEAESWQTLLQVVQTVAQYVQNPRIAVDTMLVLIESTTRCTMGIVNAEIKTQLLSMVGESIITSLMGEITRPTPSVDENRIVQLLSLASQLIRFSDVPAQEGVEDAVAPTAHPLLPFLIAFWPVLRQLSEDQRVAQCSGIGSAIFEIFSKVLLSVGSAVFSEVPNITSAILGATASRSASAGAALSCARVLVECLCRHAQTAGAGGDAAVAEESRQHLLAMVVSVTDQYVLCPQYTQLTAQPASAGSSGACMLLFGQTADAMEAYFSLVHTYVLFCRSDFAANAAQLPDKVLGLACLCLTHCTEKEPLRALLHALQGLFVPLSDTPAAAQVPLLVALSQCGDRLVHLLLQLLSDGRMPAALVPNVTEALYCLLIGCETPIFTGSPQPTLVPQCQQWVTAAVMNPALFQPLSDPAHRQLLGRVLLGFAESRSRRFKSLLQDVHKICGSELTVDTLLGYA